MGNSKAIRQQAKKHGARGRAKQIPRTELTIEAKTGQNISDAFDNFEPEYIDEEAEQYMRVPDATTLNRVIKVKYEKMKRDRQAAIAIAEAEVVGVGSNALIERANDGSAASGESSIPKTASSSNSKSEKHQVAE